MYVLLSLCLNKQVARGFEGRRTREGAFRRRARWPGSVNREQEPKEHSSETSRERRRYLEHAEICALDAHAYAQRSHSTPQLAPSKSPIACPPSQAHTCGQIKIKFRLKSKENGFEACKRKHCRLLFRSIYFKQASSSISDIERYIFRISRSRFLSASSIIYSYL